MAGAGRKKQVRFARPEAEDTRRGGEGPAAEQSLLPEPAPRPEVIVAGGGGGRSRTGEGATLLLRWCISGVLCSAFLGLGMSIAVLGPTFQDLAANVNKNVSDIYYIFMGRSLGYLVGSVIGGIVFDCMNPHLLLGLTMLGTAVGLYAIPWCKKALLLTALMSVIGTSMGVLDTGGNVLALNIWGAEAGPHMQALHFSFALGAVVAPILTKMVLSSFISPKVQTEDEKTNHSVPSDIPNALSGSALKLHSNVSFMWSYIVIGTYILIVSLLFVVLYSRTGSARDKAKSSLQKCQIAKYHYALLILLFLFFFCYVGAEVTYGSYIFNYAEVYADMKESEAASLNSLFWGAFAACRGLAICFATCLYPGTMILLSIIGSTVSSLFLALLSKHPISLWTGTAVYGASMATVFPSGISWIEQYTTIQGKSASLFVVGAALGEMCIPAVVGFLEGKLHNVPVMMYAALGTSVMTAVLFLMMYKLATSPSESKLKDGGGSEDQKALLSNFELNEDEEDEEEAGEWNEADFEVIEMNDTVRNSVVETSQKMPGESPTKASMQPPSNIFSSSPVIALSSPGRKQSNRDREKND
ncbi:sodium-dependent glucose transporter 1 [Chelonoidis abingdonii]|uniref:sodium-dependent glucose transporter 1 n=1 Tax=Chelonoidis abingdonii TaxID=106734 RepID=UPI0013F181AB|nr:sodium-dependent glucose transporter 1 [Chelonoidis abingdonii]XP_032647716.1 sodium-dependent glucose transporter 1 [Chelonoidis abingdonii]XP_032647717.1 sodium-dependent glucose transporter 1 [Chelonoidis abingdonii]